MSREATTPAIKGAVVGLGNALVIALGAGAMVGASTNGAIAFFLVMMLGMLPAILVGALIGKVAGAVDRSPLIRYIFIAWLGVLTVAVLGTALTQAAELVLPAYIPTLAAAAVLERWTRRPAAIPTARIA